MLLHGLRCYTLCFIIAICATEDSRDGDDWVDVGSNENTENTQEEAKSSQEKTIGSSELTKVKAEVEPVEVDNLLPAPTDKVDTEVEVSDHYESKEEKKEGSAQSTPKDTYPNSDGDNMLKKDFEAFKTSKNSAENFAHIANMTEILGFNYSPAEIEKFKIWLNGVVPFFIDEFSFDKIVRDKIREYLDSTNSLTGLQFLEIPKPPDDDRTRWIFFVNRRGQLDCTDYYHDSFTDTGVQKVILGYDCLVGRREMAALVLAIAGIPPQHNSPDRDTYIEVSMKSIQPGKLTFNFELTRCTKLLKDKKSFFKAVSPQQWIFYELKYDFLSAGHYSSHKYTADGTATITAKNKNNEPVGEAEDFSYTDLKKIRMLYNYIASEANKNLKLPDCQILYRPGSNFKNLKLQRPQKHVRKKPQQYIEATKKAGEQILDEEYRKEEEKNPDMKRDPDMSDETKEKMNVELNDENYDSVTKENQADIQISYGKKTNDTTSLANKKRNRGIFKKKKKHTDAIDPLKWDDIKTDESN